MKWTEDKKWQKDRQWLHEAMMTDEEEIDDDDDVREISVGADGDTTMEDATSQSPAKGTKRKGDQLPAERMDKAGRDADGNPVQNASATTTLAKSAAGSASGSNGTGETPVDLSMPRELGFFTETRTAALPIKFYCSANKIARNPANVNVLKIRMNSPYGILGKTTFVDQTEGAAVTSGISAHQANAYGATNDTPLLNFETTIRLPTAPTASAAGAGVPTDGEVRPAWLLHYAQFYESMHVIETKYRITFVSPETEIGRRVNAFIDKDVYTASSTGNTMPSNYERFYYNSQFKRVDKVIIGERNNNDARNWIQTYEGTWRPGMWSKNTLNAEDIKAWYSTGAEPSPSWHEELQIVFTTDEFIGFTFANLNIMVELEYVIQFKDLVGKIRYPLDGTNIIGVSYPSDVMQKPNSAYNWGSTV